MRRSKIIITSINAERIGLIYTRTAKLNCVTLGCKLRRLSLIFLTESKSSVPIVAAINYQVLY